jgi:transposase InsO family protein
MAAAPDRLWVADTSYLSTWEGWLYLVAVQDGYSRRTVGWAMDSHMRTELVTDALQMALARRRPAPGLIWHSDQRPGQATIARVVERHDRPLPAGGLGESRIRTGVQSGVQVERMRGELRATQSRSDARKQAQQNRNSPAGGRAVAGSNPVSPM